MLKLEKIVEHYEFRFKLEGYKKVMIYIGIMSSLIINMYSLELKGYPIGELFFAEALPTTVSTYKNMFFKQYSYLLSGVIIGEPLTLLTNSIPYLEQNAGFKASYDEVVGYFTPSEQQNHKEEQTKQPIEETQTHTMPQVLGKVSIEALKDPQYVFNNLMSAKAEMEFGVDMIQEWDFSKLAKQPIRLDESIKGPQILIFHTHAREEFRGGITVVDVAEALKKELEEKYGISVLHIKDSFYETSNHGNRPTGGEYETMEPVIQKVLEENPSISVVIDMHRDGVQDNVHLVTDINGKQTAKIMFVTPLCRNRNVAGEVVNKEDIPNPYLSDNLAFALQMYLTANEDYPGFSRKIFCSEWRYSTHMKPQSLLLEWGAQTNTGEEALNAVDPMTKVLAKVLGKD